MKETSTPATIMVVDDTPENLNILRELLEEKGFRVVAFPNGRMALNAAIKNPPDLILLDIMMPDMNGFEVCERIKNHDTLRDIPILFISALSETKDKIQAFAAGGVDYVTKPFHVEEVYARVQTHLERHQEKRKLQSALDKLRELEDLRDNLIHMIVHDMRSLLMGIDGVFQVILREKGQLSPKHEKFLTMGTVNCRKMIDMVNSLLDLSRLEAGQMPVQSVLCDLVNIAKSAVQSVELLAQQKGLTIRYPDQPVKTVVDPHIIQRVITNLLTNAIHYSPEGATIAVGIGRVAGGVRVEVTDEGEGIPAEYHTKIFEKFGQVEVPRRSRAYSSGIGLSFCKLAVEAHGGRIGLESEEGKGSTFWFELPSENTH